MPATRVRIRSASATAWWPSATASSTRSPVTDEMTSSTAESPVRMSHSKIHIIGGGSRPIARTFCSANGPMYRPWVTASRDPAIASVTARTVAGSSENQRRAQSAVTAPTSASGSRASEPASTVFSS